jgi:hypothetical protein
MSQTPNFRLPIAILLAGGVVLPIALCLIFGVGAMLAAMGDSSAAIVFNAISVAVAILWVLDLITLVLLLGLHFLFGGRKNGDNTEEP